MTELTKRATIYLEPELHKALRIKSAETTYSISDMVNDAIRNELASDADDLAAFRDRRADPVMGFEEFVSKLKRDGRI